MLRAAQTVRSINPVANRVDEVPWTPCSSCLGIERLYHLPEVTQTVP